MAYASKTAAALFQWVVVQLQKHKFAVLLASLQEGGDLWVAHSTAQTQQEEAEAEAAVEAAAAAEAAARAVAKAAEATGLRAKIDWHSIRRLDRLAVERRERTAAPGEAERRAEEEEVITRVSRRLLVISPFHNETLRGARVRFGAGGVTCARGDQHGGQGVGEEQDNLAALGAVAQVMHDFPTLSVNVVGNPGVGDPTDASLDMPLARAVACTAWLIEHGGVETGRLRTSSVARSRHRREDGDAKDSSRATVSFNGIRELTSVSPADHITFDSGSASISPLCRTSLKGVARFLMENGFSADGGQRRATDSGEDNLSVVKPEDVLTVEGHACGEGLPMYSDALSLERAATVAGALEAEGVDPGRLRAVGLGQSKSGEANSLAEGRPGNGRVKFLILEG